MSQSLPNTFVLFASLREYYFSNYVKKDLTLDLANCTSTTFFRFSCVQRRYKRLTVNTQKYICALFLSKKLFPQYGGFRRARIRDMIRERAHILYLLFLWQTHTRSTRLSDFTSEVVFCRRNVWKFGCMSEKSYRTMNTLTTVWFGLKRVYKIKKISSSEELLTNWTEDNNLNVQMCFPVPTEWFLCLERGNLSLVTQAHLTICNPKIEITKSTI